MNKPKLNFAIKAYIKRGQITLPIGVVDIIIDFTVPLDVFDGGSESGSLKLDLYMTVIIQM